MSDLERGVKKVKDSSRRGYEAGQTVNGEKNVFLRMLEGSGAGILSVFGIQGSEEARTFIGILFFGAIIAGLFFVFS